MRVHELIAKLQTMPQDLQVYVDDRDYGPGPVAGVKEREEDWAPTYHWNPVEGQKYVLLS